MPEPGPIHRLARSLLPALLLYGALAAGAALTLLPLLWMLAASLMPAGEANSYPPRLWPSTVTFEHYAALFTRLDLGRYLLNSALLAGATTLISLFINSMAG
ncbi:MAG TPA: carbohydrate ABC transporter permease, partial [Candidatus Contendobacter sp.]|nr:carbohydrate ABC transporter permease [Candidatus Contendobacter sp.]